MRSEERPLRREDGEALITQVRQALDSGVERATIRFADQQLVLERDPSGEITLRRPDQAVTTRVYLEMNSRPPYYPIDLPFVAGEPVTISDEQGQVALFWWVPKDPDVLFAKLGQESRSGGWILKDDTQPPSIHGRGQTYERGQIRRYLRSSFGFVSILQLTWPPVNVPPRTV